MARQTDVGGKRVAALPECQGRAQSHRRVSVVSAGVHHAVAGRSVRDRLGVVNSEGVDIGPERDHGPATVVLRAGDEASSRSVRSSADPRLLQLLGQESRGLVLLPAGLGMGMKPAANLAEHACA